MRRITTKEYNKGIFCPKKPEKQVKKTKKLGSVYTVLTKCDYRDDDGYPVIEDENSQFAYARKSETEFFVKSNGGTLLDPHNMYDRDIYRKVGDHSIWQWKKVSQNVFELYLAYLKTNNKSYYLNASREIL